ncbi:MAG TPA: bifunctional nuclease family protein [Syntrophaceae bacterium]|nr:bifunctional nuclease family protein [Syntrophaceae bacterium]
MFRKMKVFGLAIDPFTNSPIMILKDVNGEKSVPIWIGMLEATAIASELEKINFSRPMTHDLLRNIIHQLGAEVIRVEVCDLKDNTFYALIHIHTQDKEFAIDARPSDAIALALRTESPIFVAEEVIKRSKSVEMGHKEEIKTEEGKKWTEILEKLSPEDFGKYKM